MKSKFKHIYKLLILSSLFISTASVAQDSKEQFAQTAANGLVMELKSQLQAKMKAGGPLEAIPFCNKEAIHFTQKVVDEFPDVIGIKRTSRKIRNPINKADENELAAIAHFEKQIVSGQPLEFFRQDLKDEIRFYKPMKVGGECLVCHGNINSKNNPVGQKIKELYPNDQAHGYKAGDFRGVVRVSVKK